jgi:hypothetical protein
MPDKLSEMGTEEFVQAARWAQTMRESSAALAYESELLDESLRRLEAAEVLAEDRRLFCDQLSDALQSAANPKVNKCSRGYDGAAYIVNYGEGWKVICSNYEVCDRRVGPFHTIPEACEKWNEENEPRCESCEIAEARGLMPEHGEDDCPRNPAPRTEQKR